jgi:hypothetical protein
VGIWKFYLGNNGHTFWFNHREDDGDVMSYDLQHTHNGTTRPFYFWTPTQKMKAIPNTFSRNFHGAMHADTGVIGWMPNFGIKPLSPKINGTVFFGVKKTDCNCIQGVYLGKTDVNRGIFIIEAWPKDLLCIHMRDHLGVLTKNWVTDPAYTFFTKIPKTSSRTDIHLVETSKETFDFSTWINNDTTQ